MIRFLLSGIAEGCLALVANKFRSLLTMLGITIGVMAIVAVVSMPQTAFMHTGAGVKSSVLFLRKLSDKQSESVANIKKALQEDASFDELKTGLLSVLGKIHTPESFELLAAFTDHESPYVVNWTAQALAEHQNPAALPYLEKAKERLGALTKIAGG